MALKTSKEQGLSLTEVVIAVGIIALAALTILSLCATVLRYRRQSTNSLNAARVSQAVLERTVVSIGSDLPAGVKDDFWAATYSYPGNPFKSGTESIGRESFEWKVFTSNVDGIGDSTKDPPNILRRIDVYVWWREPNNNEPKQTIATRVVNSGLEP